MMKSIQNPTTPTPVSAPSSSWITTLTSFRTKTSNFSCRPPTTTFSSVWNARKTLWSIWMARTWTCTFCPKTRTVWRTPMKRMPPRLIKTVKRSSTQSRSILTITKTLTWSNWSVRPKNFAWRNGFTRISRKRSLCLLSSIWVMDWLRFRNQTDDWPSSGQLSENRGTSPGWNHTKKCDIRKKSKKSI